MKEWWFSPIGFLMDKCSEEIWSIVWTQIIQYKYYASHQKMRNVLWYIVPDILRWTTSWFHLSSEAQSSETLGLHNTFGVRCAWKQSTQSPSCSPVYRRCDNMTQKMWREYRGWEWKTYSSSVTMNHYSSNVTFFYHKTRRQASKLMKEYQVFVVLAIRPRTHNHKHMRGPGEMDVSTEGTHGGHQTSFLIPYPWPILWHLFWGPARTWIQAYRSYRCPYDLLGKNIKQLSMATRKKNITW